ncbi:MAG: ChaN family lipoprotein, partial [Planctomycetota bacterium]
MTPYRPIQQLAAALPLLAVLVGCVTTESQDYHGRGSVTIAAPKAPSRWEAPAIERASVVVDAVTGQRISFAEMLDGLRPADVVFVGESHNDESTHHAELAIYEGLLERHRGRVVLALEMFERDVQPVLDMYLAGDIPESEFLDRARVWSQYQAAYRPLVETARQDGHPVVASNIPRELARKISRGGIEILATLDPETRSHAPTELFANTAEYWERVDNAIRGHVGRMRMSESDDGRLTSTQTLWDNTMGESCAMALDSFPRHAVVHINGAFHSQNFDGTVRQFLLRKPGASVKTVDIRPVRSPSSVPPASSSTADYIVYVEARASHAFSGVYSITLDRDLEYRLHVPESASLSNPAPLLVWFVEEGLTAKDGMALWRDRIGTEVAIAVIEPPYRATQPDLSEGGQWFWPDSFSGDVGSIVSATDRIWAYLARTHPIDPDRVCIAGEGNGAVLAAATSVFGARIQPTAIAFDPARYAALKDVPLPLGGGTLSDRRLTVFGDEAAAEWWTSELDSYRGLGMAAEFRHSGSLVQSRDAAQEGMLRDALGLDPDRTTDASDLVAISMPSDSPRARHWSRLYALRYEATTGRSVRLVDMGL